MACDQSKLSQPNPEGWTSLRPDQIVTLQARSPLHRGTYECTVLSVSSSYVSIAMPMEHGKLVLIPVGTRVDIEFYIDGNKRTIEAVVADRISGADRSLTLRPATVSTTADHVAQKEKLCRVVSVTSGKGGVGKSFFAVNFGAALAELGLRVAVIDVDLGTANVDVLLNVSPRYNLSDIVYGTKTVFDVLIEGPGGLVILPGASGLQDLADLTESQFQNLHHQFKLLQKYVDIMLLDTGSGLSRAVTRFVLASDEAIVVTTPEPHAIVDAYALVKVLAADGADPLHLQLVINKVTGGSEADAIATKMMFAGERFLQTKLTYLGYVVQDEAVGQAVRQQQLLLDARPMSAGMDNLRKIAREYARTLVLFPEHSEVATRSPESVPARPRTFLQRVRDLFSR